MLNYNFMKDNSRIIQPLLDSLSATHDAWIKFVSKNGDYILPQNKNKSNFCRLVQSHPEGVIRCRDSSIMSVFLEPNKPHLYTCHAGLIMLTVPLFCGGELLGSLAVGEIRIKDSQGDRSEMIRKLSDINLDKNILLQYYDEIPMKQENDIMSLGQILCTISTCFLSLGVAITERHKIEMEKALIESELKALNSQINPHFLFNTLNAIQMISYLEDADQTSKIINALAKLLRSKLDPSTHFITIREELEIIQNLVYIQQTRFADKFQVSISIPEEMLDLQIPIFSLQPLVENAFVHGLEPLEGVGKLGLRGYIWHNDVYILIKDNGCGIDEDRLANINEALNNQQNENIKGIALENINHRCRTYFGDDYGIKVDSKKNEGTEICLCIPVMKKGCNLRENIAG